MVTTRRNVIGVEKRTSKDQVPEGPNLVTNQGLVPARPAWVETKHPDYPRPVGT